VFGCLAGQGGHSSECSPSEHSEEELTEQEQVYGKGIWGECTAEVSIELDPLAELWIKLVRDI